MTQNIATTQNVCSFQVQRHYSLKKSNGTKIVMRQKKCQYWIRNSFLWQVHIDKAHSNYLQATNDANLQVSIEASFSRRATFSSWSPFFLWQEAPAEQSGTRGETNTICIPTKVTTTHNWGKNSTKMIFLRFLLNCCIVLSSVSFSRWATNTSQRISRVPFVRLFILIRHNSFSRVYDFLKLLNGFALAIKLSRKDIRSPEDTY